MVSGLRGQRRFAKASDFRRKQAQRLLALRELRPLSVALNVRERGGGRCGSHVCASASGIMRQAARQVRIVLADSGFDQRELARCIVYQSLDDFAHKFSVVERCVSQLLGVEDCGFIRHHTPILAVKRYGANTPIALDRQEKCLNCAQV